MKKRLMALLLATTVIASGCGAEDETDEKDVEVSESDEESDEESEEESDEESDEDSDDDNSFLDIDTEVSDDGIKLDGSYTDGHDIFTFSGDEFTFFGSNVEFTAKFKFEDNKIIVDMDTIELTDAFMDFYEEYSKDHSCKEPDQLIESLKKEEKTLKIKYNEEKNTLEFDYNTYYYVENDLGPNGVYTCEDNENITITFEDGEVTFDNDGNKETFSYNCFKDRDKLCISFYGFGFSESEFYEAYGLTEIKDVDVDEIEFRGVIFKK